MGVLFSYLIRFIDVEVKWEICYLRVFMFYIIIGVIIRGYVEVVRVILFLWYEFGEYFLFIEIGL